MPHAVDAACRESLRRAGLPGQGPLLRLLALLRAAPATHLRLGEVLHMAAETRLIATPLELAEQLETLVSHGLLGRLPSTAPEPVFDTVPKAHSHLIYEETEQTIDLDVSAETLLAIIRHTLAERPGGVEIMVRVRRDPAPAAARAAAGPAGRRTEAGRADRRE